jgi:hypothetical protein
MVQITIGQVAGVIAAAIFVGMYPPPAYIVSSSKQELKLGYGLQLGSL